MICEDCATAAFLNRKVSDNANYPFPVPHPVSCGCPCMHKPTAQWEDMYSIERPGSDTEES